ncbi:LysR family transcriptional regulator [Massilia cavernae]|nr:LysR family transcriptional regulator [Massilia cavernae]
MDFSFRHVEVFWAVMTSGSATGAAAMLHTSQPTISRELSRFEKLSQLTLFKRSGGKLVPTEHGLMLFDEVQRSYLGLERIGNAAEAIRHFRHGQIAVACLPAFSSTLLPRASQQFRSKFPGVSLNVTPLETPALQESLTSQSYHLGLTEDPGTPQGTRLETLLVQDVVCVLPVGHALCEKRVLTPQDFSGQDFIYLAAADPYRKKVDSLFRTTGIERRMVVETHSAAAVCATVNLGVGVAIVNPLTALEYTGLGLQIRRFSHSIPYSVNMVTPLFRPESPGMARFVDALRESCRQISEELHAVMD